MYISSTGVDANISRYSKLYNCKIRGKLMCRHPNLDLTIDLRGELPLNTMKIESIVHTKTLVKLGASKIPLTLISPTNPEPK